MKLNGYKLMAYDKKHKDIKEVCIINLIEGTCSLTKKNRNSARITVNRKMESVTFLNSTGKKDINGDEILEGHIIESTLSADKMLVNYGEYDAYCPVDRQIMKNVGFYVSMEGCPDMPLGPTEEYAEIIGHINIDPKLIQGGY